jgi:bifunctional non-homologous end joining protein LigD
MESITLYFREGSSDKVYQASIQPQGGGHMVHFAYGRRGSTLTTGTKTTSPVDYQTAKSIFDKLVREKTAKGYTPGEDGTRYQHTEKAAKATGIQCQLLNPVIEERVEDLIHDREHWMQEKMDGRRLLLQKEGSLITGINRLGLGVSIPKTIADSASRYRHDFLIDGEAVGDTLHVFDLLFISGEDMRTRAFATRYFRLRDMLDAFDHPHLNLVPSYCFPEKKEWFHRFKEAGKRRRGLQACGGTLHCRTPEHRRHAAQAQVPRDGLLHRHQAQRQTQRVPHAVGERQGAACGQCHHPAEPRHPQTRRGRGVPVSLRLQGVRLDLPAGLSRQA